MLDHEQVRERLRARTHLSLSTAGLRRSAVLLPLFRQGNEDMILFTRRTDALRHHRGEISFPGGACHAEDAGPSETALRETEEEMGIASSDVCMLGRLDDCISSHGYHVTPFVGSFPYPYRYTINRDEIAEVIEVSIHRLRDPAIYHEEDWRDRGRLYPVCFYTIGRHQIWGLTAEILRQFLQRVFA